MSEFLDKFKKQSSALSDVQIKSSKEMLVDALKITSGVNYGRTTKFDIFYQIVAFRGVRDGLGTSLIVSNVALALATLGLRVCVLDTSMLRPTQDLYLRTDLRDRDEKVLDWFDMNFTDKNVLNTSKIDSNISVLSFTDRNIVDMLSTADTEELVITAYKELTEKFDIVLVDICNEPTSVSTSAMQYAHIVYQVWGNDRLSLSHIDDFIKNNTILACPTGKLSNIITSSTIDDISHSWDSIFKRYGFREIAHVGLSMDIARASATGQTLWQLASSSPAIEEFNICILKICEKILGENFSNDAKLKELDKSKLLKTEDILDGKVEGTSIAKMNKKKEESGVSAIQEKVIRDTAQAVEEMKNLQDKDVKESEVAEVIEEISVSLAEEQQVVEKEAPTKKSCFGKFLNFIGFGEEE